MTGQDLKNSILQLAIQGKLVPQDANDEPASVLLERIKAEKKKLIEEKKIKKEKPLAEITEDEMPFEIPESWVWCRIGEIYNFIDYRGKTPTKITQGIPLITATNIKEGYLDFTSEVFISEEEYETRKSRGITKKGDILFTTEAPMGHASINTLETCSCGQRIITLQAWRKELNNNLFCFYILSPFYQSQIKDNASGMTATGIKGDTAKNLLIPLPPLSEQRRIVAKIEELMPLIDEYDKAQKELDALNSAMPEQLKQSLLQEAIMGKLDTNNPDDEPASELLKRIREEKAQLIKEKKIKKEKPLPEITEEEKPFEIPENWEWVRLQELCNFLSRGKSPKYSEVKKYPVFAQKCNLKQGGISLEQARFLDPETISKWDETYKLIDGDVLVNSTGTGTVGRTRLFNSSCLGKYPFVVPDSHVSVIRTFKEINSQFIHYCLISHLYQQYFEDNLAGSTNQKELYIGTLAATIIPLPPLSEQHRIVEKLDALLPMISELAKSK